MVLPIIGAGDRLLDFNDGLWVQRLLPIYDYARNLLHPAHYDSLFGRIGQRYCRRHLEIQ